MTITIHPDELIVGNRSPLPRMGVVTPSAAVEWIDKELETLPSRPQDSFEVDAEDIRVLREEVFPYWRGKTLEDVVAAAIPPKVQVARDCKVVKLNQTDHAQGHILPNVEQWLSEGVSGLKAKAIATRDLWTHRGELTQERRQFYEAAIICLDAAAEFMHRYGDLASEQARSTDGPTGSPRGSTGSPRGLGQAHSTSSGQAQEETSLKRRRELERIARNCHHLASSPPRDYWEALQAIRFLFVLLQVESNASSFSPGRLDQYLLPFLRQDLAAGSLALDRIMTLNSRRRAIPTLFLEATTPLTSAELAARLDLTPRIVRYNLDAVERWLAYGASKGCSFRLPGHLKATSWLPIGSERRTPRVSWAY